MEKLRALYTKHLGYKLEVDEQAPGAYTYKNDGKVIFSDNPIITKHDAKTKIKKLLYPWLICFFGALFYCYEYALRIFPSVVAQPLTHSFGITAAGLGGLAAFYYYAYDFMQIPVGLLVDNFNIKRLLVFAVGICIIGSSLFLMHPLALAETGRFLVGFGSAFAFVGTLKLVTIWLPPNRFAIASGAVLTIGMLGAALSDVVLGELGRVINWRALGIVLIILGLLLAILIWFKVPASNNVPTGPATQNIKHRIKQLFNELMQLVKNKQLLQIGLVGCLLYLPLSLFAEFWSIPFLHQAYTLSTQIAARVTSLVFIGMAMGSLLIGFISDLIKKRCLPIIVCSGILTGLFCFVLLVPHINADGLYWIYFLIGFFSSAQALVFALARETTKQRMAGTAIAITNMIVMLGGALFQPLVGFLLDLISGVHAAGNLNLYPGKDFRIVLFILPLCAALGCYLTLKIKDTCAKLCETA
jgi:MFS family permease